MLANLIASVFGGPIVDGLLNAYKAKLGAANTTEAHAVDLAKADIAAGIQARANAKEIRLATAGFLEVRVLFFLLGLGFTMHLFAICVGTTFAPLLPASSWLLHIPALPSPIDQYEAQIVAFFFGAATAMNGIQAAAAALLRRGR